MPSPATNTYISAILTFLMTFSFSYAYKIQKKPSSISKCLASGIILAAIIVHIIPDIYQNETAPICCAFSFIFLFALDKIFICGEEMPKNVGVLKAITFICALSIHSLFEGLSCASRDHLVAYLIGLLGHKWAEAYVFGLSIREVFKARTTLYLVLFYSLLTPLGMLFGLVCKGHQKIEDVMNGLSGGSFFYIGFVEMLSSNYVDNKDVRKKTMGVVGGFSVMSVLLYIMEAYEKAQAQNK